MFEGVQVLTLLKPSQFVDRLAAPSHFLEVISETGSSNVGLRLGILAGFLAGLLGFQPNGLSEIPLYKEKSLEHVELDLDVAFIGVRKDEVRKGRFGGPAIDKAKDRLISMMNTR